MSTFNFSNEVGIGHLAARRCRRRALEQIEERQQCSAKNQPNDNVITNVINNADVKTKQKIKFNLLEIGKIFGILQENPDTWLGYGQSKNINQDTIERLIKERNEARRNKNFDMADEIRKKLKEEGVEIEDTSEGTIWRSI